MTVRLRLMLVALALFGLFLAGLFWSMSIMALLRSDALVVNLTGRQRMLSQKMSKEALLYAAAPTEFNRNQLRRAMVLFDRTHDTLRNGGKAAMNLDGTDEVELPRAVDRVFMQRLDQVTPLRNQLETTVDQLIADHTDKTALREILEANSTMMLYADEAVKIAQHLSERRVSRLVLVQVLFLLCGCALLVVLLLLGHQIGGSLSRLSTIASRVSQGEVAVPVPVPISGPAEVRDLARAFERMRISIKKIMEQFE